MFFFNSVISSVFHVYSLMCHKIAKKKILYSVQLFKLGAQMLEQTLSVEACSILCVGKCSIDIPCNLHTVHSYCAFIQKKKKSVIMISGKKD